MFSTAPIRASLARRRRRLPSFWLKVAGAVAIVALADFLTGYLKYAFGLCGGAVGLFGLASLCVVVATRPALLREPRSGLAIAIAAVLCAALFNDPGSLEFVGLWAAMATAVMLTRASSFGDTSLWTRRLLLAGCQAILWLPCRDIVLLAQPRLRRSWPTLRISVTGALVPLAGTIVFGVLFAQANPIIARLIPAVDIEAALQHFSIGRMIFWIIVFCAIWGLLRPRLRIRPMRNVAGALVLEFVRAILLSPCSLVVSLIAFNLLFAVQNALDLVFLYGGAALPDGMTFADYAHRGTHPLIVTALLAALFVLVAMRPGTGRATRLLVLVWVGQNVLLVGFSVLRTLDYVAAYDLTELRLAALIWMGLVAFGLGSIVLRILYDRSTAWLINVNTAAAGIVLVVSSFADLPGWVAHYNVRHAREITGEGQPLDRAYLFHGLRTHALPAMSWLVAQPVPPDLRQRTCEEFRRTRDALIRAQSHWFSWSGIDARILAALGDENPTACIDLLAGAMPPPLVPDTTSPTQIPPPL